MTRASCNTVGTALALGVAFFAALGCQGGVVLPAPSEEEPVVEDTEDTEASLQPEPKPARNDPEPAQTDPEPPAPVVGGSGGAAGDGNPEGNPDPVGIAGSAGEGPGGAGAGGAPPVNACWQLPVITRARLLPAPGRANELVGSKIMGSNTSAMNGFADLGAVGSASEGAWVELSFPNPTAYRYVKFYAAPGSRGVLAEVEFYAGDTRLSGEEFGTSGSYQNSGNTFDRALDGNPATFFEGPLVNDGYVGIDVATGHIAAAPSVSPPAGDYRTAPTVTLQAEAGATLLYTVDGSDPATNGIPYTGPVALPERTTLLRAFAQRECTLSSEVTQSIFRLPEANPDPTRPPPVQSSIHIGNSLTDTIVEYLEPLAQSGGVQLDFNRYTIPGAGTWLYETNPTGGFGVENVQEALRTRSFDHVSMQPASNMPCQYVASTGGSDPGPDSDSGYIDQAWVDALSQNPDVQLWVYQQWPEPLDFTNCITGGGEYIRGDVWDPPAPANWNEAVMNELDYHEELVDVLISLQPDAPRPYIVPGGLGLIKLREAMESGRIPGYTSFFAQIFENGGTDIHLTRPGAYFMSLIFYAVMFQSSPVETGFDPSVGLTDQQALIFQDVAWETVMGYAGSGVAR